MHKIAAKTAILPAALMMVFLFFGNVDHSDNRIIKEAWQTGHFFLFATLAYILTQLEPATKLNRFKLFGLVVITSIILGIVTELLQYFVGRSLQLEDLINDVVGAIAGFLATQIGIQKTWTKNVTMVVLFLVTSIIGLQKFLMVSYDNYQVAKNAPVLSDFETPFEQTRWLQATTINQVTDEQARNGKYSLKVTYNLETYPHSILRQFYSDWRGYQSFNFSVYNPNSENEKMFLAIQDMGHWGIAYGYDKRFNKKLELAPGWNDFNVALEDIRKGPKDRTMQLSKMVSVSFILDKPKEAKVFYIDNLYLSK
ncbi:hypothetical protein FLL45_08540 [Aliikangiella marina]|uniref:VanZ-like domain-containing protein n=1 Tax=Aliikangiella marina TaxID=1712262 RepID=A0A545TCN3_9GAMM|nr:VanZ family protein [Aliikangiella marina]TQV74980.1 hypothetical protein FLL45_08540 [Aliikangiella marina]